MPKPAPTSIIKTEVVSPDLDRLEALVTEFTSKADKMLEEDHKKVELVYDFMFLGQPQADPPVLPFVAQVQNSLSSHERSINSIRSAASRVFWIIVGLLMGGAFWFIGQTLTHLLAAK